MSNCILWWKWFAEHVRFKPAVKSMINWCWVGESNDNVGELTLWRMWRKTTWIPHWSLAVYTLYRVNWDYFQGSKIYSSRGGDQGSTEKHFLNNFWPDAGIWRIFVSADNGCPVNTLVCHFFRSAAGYSNKITRGWNWVVIVSGSNLLPAVLSIAPPMTIANHRQIR